MALPPFHERLFQAHLAQLRRLVEQQGVAGVRELYEDAKRDLEARLRALGPPNETATQTQLRAMIAQAEAVLSQVSDRLEEKLQDIGALAGTLGGRQTIDEYKRLEQHFKGTTPVLDVERGAIFRGMVQGVTSSLLTRYRLQTKTWSAGAIANMERQLSVGTMAGTPLFELVNEITKRNGLLDSERWKAERIARTEGMYAHGAVKQAAMERTNATVGRGQLLKRLIETFDDRTGDDSFVLHGQLVPISAPFEWKHKKGGAWVVDRYMHPPNRPNDRAVVVPWDPTWEMTEVERPMSIAELGSAATTHWRSKPGVEIPPGHKPGLPYDAGLRRETERIETEALEYEAESERLEREGLEREEAERRAAEEEAAKRAETERRAAEEAAAREKERSREAEIAASRAEYLEQQAPTHLRKPPRLGSVSVPAWRSTIHPEPERSAHGYGFGDFKVRGLAENLVEEFGIDEGVRPAKTDDDRRKFTEASIAAKVAVASLPPPVQRLLVENGRKFIVANSLIDADPELSGKHPRGWPESSVWEDVGGVHNRRTKKAIVARFDPTPAHTALHEIGHALDDALGRPLFTDEPENVEALSRDRYWIRIHEQAVASGAMGRWRKWHSYYVQPGDAGPQEWFAEVMADIWSSPEERARVKEILPDAYAFLESRVGGAILKKQEEAEQAAIDIEAEARRAEATKAAKKAAKKGETVRARRTEFEPVRDDERRELLDRLYREHPSLQVAEFDSGALRNALKGRLRKGDQSEERSNAYHGQLNALMASRGLTHSKLIETELRRRRLGIKEPVRFLKFEIREQTGDLDEIKGASTAYGHTIIRRDIAEQAGKFLAGDRTLPAIEGMSVLVHEAVHGHSPRTEEVRGWWKAMEELTTEAASRRIMRDTFSLPIEDVDKAGAYNEWMPRFYGAMKSALGTAGIDVDRLPPHAKDALRDAIDDAAVLHRRETIPAVSPEEFLERYVRRLDLPPFAEMAPGGVDAIRKASIEALRPVFEEIAKEAYF